MTAVALGYLIKLEARAGAGDLKKISVKILLYDLERALTSSYIFLLLLLVFICPSS